MKKNNKHTEITNDDLYEHHRIVADKGQALLRIDKFLVDRLPHAARNQIQNAIKCGAIKVNGEAIKSNYKIKPKDIITVSLPNPPRDEDIIPEDIPLNIIFEDNYIVVVNKPAGMVIHPAYNNWTGTLVNALAFHLTPNSPPLTPGPLEKEKRGTGEMERRKTKRFTDSPIHPFTDSVKNNSRGNLGGRVGLVHRIDKDTSGLVVIAKSELALTYLAKQFFDHTVERTYLALVWGTFEKSSSNSSSSSSSSSSSNSGSSSSSSNENTITGNIGRSLKDRRVMTVFPDGEHGKPAVTHFKVLKSFHYVSLIQCNLETGRMHQIRAHMKYIGHPLFNDAVYGGDKILKGPQFSKYKAFVKNCFKIIPRQALHAKSLGFIHPGRKKQVSFECELAEDFKKVLEKWENYTN